jgi:CRISPR-associated protein Cas5h
MSNETCIVLDVWGDYGHFRKPATTSPAQTFGLPPRTTIAGMIASMLGLPRDSYYELFNRECSQVAISLESNIRRLSVPINILTTTGTTRSKGARPGQHITEHRQQTVFEVLCDPAYRIYIALDDTETMNRMEDLFAAGKSVYTLSLGLSEHLATFDYVGRFEIETDRDHVEVRTAVPGEEISLVPNPKTRYVTERSPAVMEMRADGRRTAAGSQTLTYDRRGGTIELRDAEYALVGDDHIVFA